MIQSGLKKNEQFVIIEEVGGVLQSTTISYSPLPGWAEKEVLGIDHDVGSEWVVSLVKPISDHADTEPTFRRY